MALDAVAEELCARLVRLQCEAGRVDAAKVAYRRLETELADLGVDPEDATGAVLARASRRRPAD